MVPDHSSGRGGGPYARWAGGHPTTAAVTGTRSEHVGDDHKASLRAAALAARRDLDVAERADATRRAVAALLALPEVAVAETIALFAASRDELTVDEAIERLRARGCTTLLPRVEGEGLVLVATADLAELAPGYRGIREPAGPGRDPRVADVAVLPGVAFDRAGGRLGHGGGHYDRLAARLRPDCLRVGIAFEQQVLDEVPREPHDEPVDVLVTGRTTRRTGARAR